MMETPFFRSSSTTWNMLSTSLLVSGALGSSMMSTWAFCWMALAISIIC